MNRIIKNTARSFVVTAQMQFAVLIVVAKLNLQHWLSDYNFGVTKFLLQKNSLKICKFYYFLPPFLLAQIILWLEE